jgi:hypothetical protein
MPEINPYVGEFEGRRSVPSMGGVGVRTPTFQSSHQKSKFEPTEDKAPDPFKSHQD